MHVQSLNQVLLRQQMHPTLRRNLQQYTILRRHSQGLLRLWQSGPQLPYLLLHLLFRSSQPHNQCSLRHPRRIPDMRVQPPLIFHKGN